MQQAPSPSACRHMTSETESLSNTRETRRKIQQEHSTCILFSWWNTTPLIASHTLAQATQFTREKLRNPVAPSAVADTEWQLQVWREAALALASVPGMPLFTMWIWWQCPRGNNGSKLWLWSGHSGTSSCCFRVQRVERNSNSQQHPGMPQDVPLRRKPDTMNKGSSLKEGKRCG